MLKKVNGWFNKTKILTSERDTLLNKLNEIENEYDKQELDCVTPELGERFELKGRIQDCFSDPKYNKGYCDIGLQKYYTNFVLGLNEVFKQLDNGSDKWFDLVITSLKYNKDSIQKSKNTPTTKLTNFQVFKGYYYSWNFDKNQWECKNISKYFPTGFQRYQPTDEENNKIIDNVDSFVRRVEEQITPIFVSQYGGQNNLKEDPEEIKKQKDELTRRITDINEKIDNGQHNKVIELLSKLDLYRNSITHWSKDKNSYNEYHDIINYGPCAVAGLQKPDQKGGEAGYYEAIELECVNKRNSKKYVPEYNVVSVKEKYKDNKDYEYRWISKPSYMNNGGKSRRAKKSRRKPLKKRRKTRRHTK